MKPAIVAAALTGALTEKKKQPALPCTPDEIIASAIACWHAGAAMVHVHTRAADGSSLHDKAAYAEIHRELTRETDLIVNFTTSYFPGGGMTEEDRFDVVDLEPDFASFNSGSLNFNDEGIYENSPKFMERMAIAMRDHGVRPEFEVFDTGQIGNIARMIDRGMFDPPYLVQFVLGPKGAAPPDPRLLTLMVDMLPAGSEWTALGVGVHQLHINTLALLWGGHVRTGFEDNIYIRRGELASSNAQLVGRIVELAQILERPVATCEQAREILGLTR